MVVPAGYILTQLVIQPWYSCEESSSASDRDVVGWLTGGLDTEGDSSEHHVYANLKLQHTDIIAIRKALNQSDDPVQIVATSELAGNALGNSSYVDFFGLNISYKVVQGSSTITSGSFSNIQDIDQRPITVSYQDIGENVNVKCSFSIIKFDCYFKQISPPSAIKVIEKRINGTRDILQGNPPYQNTCIINIENAPKKSVPKASVKK